MNLDYERSQPNLLGDLSEYRQTCVSGFQTHIPSVELEWLCVVCTRVAATGTLNYTAVYKLNSWEHAVHFEQLTRHMIVCFTNSIQL